MVPEISVIIPIYNAIKTLERCLESVSIQSLINFEVVLIDDGSSDGSDVVCDKWASKDERFIVFHQDNMGVTRAREKGVSLAKSEWICFVDSDDFLPVESLSLLSKKTDHDDIDIILGSIDYFGPWKWSYKYSDAEFNNYEYLKQLLRVKIHSGPYGRLFRRKLFDCSTFNISREISVGEDLIMNINLAKKSNKTIVISDIVYTYYCVVDNSKYPVLMNISYIQCFNSIIIRSIPKNLKTKLILDIIFNIMHRYKHFILHVIKYCFSKTQPLQNRKQ